MAEEVIYYARHPMSQWGGGALPSRSPKERRIRSNAGWVPAQSLLGQKAYQTGRAVRELCERSRREGKGERKYAMEGGESIVR